MEGKIIAFPPGGTVTVQTDDGETACELYVVKDVVKVRPVPEPEPDES